MAGEFEELMGVIQRRRQLREELRRTADLGQRQAIQARMEAATDELKDTFDRIRAAAEAGESEAKELIETLEDLVEGWGRRVP